MLKASRNAIIAECDLISCILAGNGGMEESDLREALTLVGAPPWVKKMGALFQWRNACTGRVMVGVAAPSDPVVRMWDLDAGHHSPVYEGPLKLLALEDDDRRKIWEALFTSQVGAWSDEEGSSISLVLE